MPFEHESPFLQEQIRTALYNHQPHYKAGDIANDELSIKTFTGIAGPFGVGKTTITNEVIRLEPSILPINTTTTRERKPDQDPPGFKTADDGVTFSLFRDAVNDGTLVNYSVLGDEIYGTFPEDFPAKYTIGPFLPSSIEHIRKAGFEHSHFVYILSAGPLWRGFIENSRRSMPTHKFKQRVDEAIESLYFAREHMRELTFIENSHGPEGIAKAARKIADIALNRSHEKLHHDNVEFYLKDMEAVAFDLSV